MGNVHIIQKGRDYLAHARKLVWWNEHQGPWFAPLQSWWSFRSSSNKNDKTWYTNIAAHLAALLDLVKSAIVNIDIPCSSVAECVNQAALLTVYASILIAILVAWIRWRRRRRNHVKKCQESLVIGREADLRHQRLDSDGETFPWRSHRPRNRFGSGSADLLLRPFNGHNNNILDDNDEDEDPLWPAYDPVKNSSASPVTYRGPTVSSILYETWSPPPTWAEASRHVVLPSEFKQSLGRQITLTLLPARNTTTTAFATEPVLSVLLPELPHASVGTTTHATTSGRRRTNEPALEVPVSQVSVYVHPPAEQCVMSIYVKESTRAEWLEQTFTSAPEAAQFQLDLLACQVIGGPIMNLFQAFQVIHLGSVAHESPEFVWHDAAWPDSSEQLHASPSCGIAWDDVMRCLGSAFPSIRWRLEALLWWHRAGSSTPDGRAVLPTPNVATQAMAGGNNNSNKDGSTTAATTEASTGLCESYVHKRLLLGPIDFFRLFVPPVASSVLPRTDSSSPRVEQFLRYRKRLARASVLVDAYVKARLVVNQGWNLARPLPETYWNGRLAFDDDLENRRRDHAADSEYYEPTVSRDVFIRVRGRYCLEKQSWWNRPEDVVPVLSTMQAYALVGLHRFQLVSQDDFPLRPERDPLYALPSLRTLIESHPEVHFFVQCTYSEPAQYCTVTVFARCLARGIDRAFDTVMDNFVNGSAETRDAKLETVLHLSLSKEKRTWWNWLRISAINALSKFHLFSDQYQTPLQRAVGANQLVVPTLNLSLFGKTFHFGGSLQIDRTLPTNYVVASVNLEHLQPRSKPITRLLTKYLNEHWRAGDIVDRTIIIAATTGEELPERALGTLRSVHGSQENSLAPVYISPTYEYFDVPSIEMKHSDQSVEPATTAIFRALVSNPLTAVVNPITQLLSPRHDAPASILDSPPKEYLQSQRALKVNTSDPFETAVNELIEILEDAEVPERVNCMSTERNSGDCAGDSDDLLVDATLKGLKKVSLLSKVDRGDLRRYFIATGCSHKRAVVRVVESVTWHGMTFPIDPRSCRIELQNGQCFQQGRDLEGNPLFYFRNMCLGLWRGDENAVIAAALHRFNSSLAELKLINPDIRYTVIFIMGKPYRKHVKRERNNDGTSHQSQEETSHNQDGTSCTKEDFEIGAANNPRVDPLENWYLHTTKRLIRRLIHLLMFHYPERLQRAFVIVGNGNTAYCRTALGGSLKLAEYVHSTRTRDKVKFLSRYSDLREYVDRNELVSIVGGYSPINESAYICK